MVSKPLLYLWTITPPKKHNHLFLVSPLLFLHPDTQVHSVRYLHTLLQYQEISEALCPTQSQILPLHDESNSIRFIFSDTSSCFHFCKYVAHIQKLLSDFSQILSAVFIIETQRKYIIFANKIPTCLFFNIMLY